MDNRISWETKESIRYTIDKVAERGWGHREELSDCFGELRRDERFRNAQIAILYEEYFLPERHEHEWQLLSDIVNFIATSPTIGFAFGSIVGGILGNTAYDALKILCNYAANIIEERLGKEAKERANSFRQIAADAELLQSFFKEKPRARIQEIEEATGLRREKIYPIIKIAGLNHIRRGEYSCYWEMPN